VDLDLTIVLLVDRRRVQRFRPVSVSSIAKALRGQRVLRERDGIAFIGPDPEGARILLDDTAWAWAWSRNDRLAILATTALPFDTYGERRLVAALPSRVASMAAVGGAYAVLFDVGTIPQFAPKPRVRTFERLVKLSDGSFITHERS
jgi:hypothetical protein